jgi:lysophospholipase L1-like esterase
MSGGSFAGALGAQGVLFWLALAVGLAAGLVALSYAIAGPGRHGEAAARPPWLFRGLLVIGSVTLVAVAAEAGLAFLERLGPHPDPKSRDAAVRARPDPITAERVSEGSAVFFPALPADVVRTARWRQTVLTEPPEWKKRDVPVPGAARAFYYYGVLHVFDQNRMRRTTPFPPRQPGVFRIMAVGDSQTYGQALDARWAYPDALERLLGRTLPVEVLNLGVSGHQSEDILKVLRRFLPELRPDLVVYGMCLNDFLPSGISQYEHLERYAVPLPPGFRDALVARARLARFVQHGYDAALRRLHLRFDFHDDILTNFQSYQDRFARDVRAMNDVATAAGLPPVVALVMDPRPVHGGRGHQIARVAERLMAAGGLDVVPTEGYYRALDGRDLTVNRFDGHPNEEAHAIYAAMLAEHLRRSVGPIRRQGPVAGPPARD